MSVRMRHTRSHTANRRSHHGIKGKKVPTLVACECGAMRQNHRACLACGKYKGSKVI